MKIIPRFECPICHVIHDDEAQAQACLDFGLGDDGGFKAGDIVQLNAGYGWYDGDKKWVINPDVVLKRSPDWLGCSNENGNCFSPCCTYEFYYVITKIGQDNVSVHKNHHRKIFHVATKAMTGKQGHRSGWTTLTNHKTPKLLTNISNELIEDSKDLIGETFNYLI